jgi:hypothetical protein
MNVVFDWDTPKDKRKLFISVYQSNAAKGTGAGEW